ncbi:hypothetical protein [Methylomonas albis]|nr:hypothetical protein [Methylomonas albis]
MRQAKTANYAVATEVAAGVIIKGLPAAVAYWLRPLAVQARAALV